FSCMVPLSHDGRANANGPRRMVRGQRRRRLVIGSRCGRSPVHTALQRGSLMKNAWKLWGVLGTAAVLGAFGCSGGSNGGTNGSNNGNNGSGGDGSGTGGTGGEGSGGTPSGTGGEGNQGTGGMTNEVPRPPHTQLFDCNPPEGTVPELALEPFLT